MRLLMPADAAALGRVIVACALIGFALENFFFRYYVVARATPWPADRSLRLALACAAAAVFLASGVVLLANRSVRVAGLASGALILGWSVILHFPKAIAGPAWSADWTNALKAATLAAGALGIAVADRAPVSPLLSRLRANAPYVAGAFFLLCGIQHFMFAEFVATLIPRFIPGASFWTYVAGLALLVAGVGFCLDQMRPLAARLTAAMVFSWVFLVHLPLVVTVGPVEWMGVFEALGISGVCLVLADPPTEVTLVRSHDGYVMPSRSRVKGHRG